MSLAEWHGASLAGLAGDSNSRRDGAPHVGDLLSELIDSDQHRLIEVPAEPELVGKPLSATRNDHSRVVLGLVQQDRVTLGIGRDPMIASGDRLLVAEPLEKAGS